MHFREFWREFPRWAKRIAAVALTVSALGLISGTLVFGNTAWWDAKGFFVNVMTSLVGALLGIPVAVILIGWFTAYNATRLERRSARRTTERAWTDFSESAQENVEQQIIDNGLEWGSAVEEKTRTLLNTLAAYAELRKDKEEGEHRLSSETIDLRPLFDAVVEDHRAMHEALGTLRIQMGSRIDWQRGWSDLRLRWTFISTEVRRIRYGQELSWIPAKSELVIETYLFEGCPQDQIDEALKPYGEFANAVAARLLSLRYNDRLEIDDLLAYKVMLTPDGLWMPCGTAASRMQEFQEAVHEADADDWRSPAITS
ncbi:hypothetical protein [Prescottella equi]|uniref:hypothetical protein n=1 Tax=Rhodococcus hoagii TaxID=43767 RepID=UPI00111C9234|nr:hypothetical protein [Prescottella equi]